MTKRILATLIALATFYSPRAQTVDPYLQNLVDQVSLDTLTKVVLQLTGESPITVGGLPYTLTSRAAGHPDNDRAADFIERKLMGYGLRTEQHEFSSTGRSVLGFQSGSLAPELIFVVCAHFDAVAAAPGADDNASGTVAVLEAARLLSSVETPFTVMYALWDEEETGLVGSKAYAVEAANAGMQIKVVINADMIGWDSDGDGQLTIQSNRTWITDAIIDANADFGIGLNPLFSPRFSSSDHVSFGNAGYPAALIIEYWDPGVGEDFNDYYHTYRDVLSNMNAGYLQQMAKLVVATIASLATDQSFLTATEPTAEPRSNISAASYPNPFSRTTTISVPASRAGRFRLDVFDVLGRVVYSASETGSSLEEHRFVVDGRDLPTGTYVYRVRTDRDVWTGSMTRR